MISGPIRQTPRFLLSNRDLCSESQNARRREGSEELCSCTEGRSTKGRSFAQRTPTIKSDLFWRLCSLASLRFKLSDELQPGAPVRGEPGFRHSPQLRQSDWQLWGPLGFHSLRDQRDADVPPRPVEEFRRQVPQVASCESTRSTSTRLRQSCRSVQTRSDRRPASACC